MDSISKIAQEMEDTAMGWRAAKGETVAVVTMERFAKALRALSSQQSEQEAVGYVDPDEVKAMQHNGLGMLQTARRKQGRCTVPFYLHLAAQEAKEADGLRSIGYTCQLVNRLQADLSGMLSSMHGIGPTTEQIHSSEEALRLYADWLAAGNKAPSASKEAQPVAGRDLIRCPQHGGQGFVQGCVDCSEEVEAIIAAHAHKYFDPPAAGWHRQLFLQAEECVTLMATMADYEREFGHENTDQKFEVAGEQISKLIAALRSSVPPAGQHAELLARAERWLSESVYDHGEDMIRELYQALRSATPLCRPGVEQMTVNDLGMPDESRAEREIETTVYRFDRARLMLQRLHCLYRGGKKVSEEWRDVEDATPSADAAGKEVKPCPFCHGPADIVEQLADGPPRIPDGHCKKILVGFLVGCQVQSCPGHPGAWREGDDPSVAISVWNRRAPTTTVTEDAQDAARLDWLTRRIGGAELRRIGIIWPAWSPSYVREAIDAAIAATERGEKGNG